MDEDIRLTTQGLRVLKLFLEKPLGSLSGAEIARTTKIGSGTLYPLLARFEQAEWLKSEWENVEPTEIGRPRRRLYRLTAEGQALALKKMSEFQFAPGVLAWN